MASSTSGSWVLSWRWPGVTTTESGLPLPSQERWSLLLSPPRLRPSASSGACSSLFEVRLAGSFSGSAGVLVHLANGAVYTNFPDEFAFGVCLALDMSEKALPGAVSAPSDETVIAGLPRTVAFWYVAPGSAGAQPPQYAVYDPAMVTPLFASAAVLW